jgi:hypothetical protein
MADLTTCRRCGARGFELVLSADGSYYHGTQVGTLAVLACPLPPIPGGWPPAAHVLAIVRCARYAARARFRQDVPDEREALNEYARLMALLATRVPTDHPAPHELAEASRRWFEDAFNAEWHEWAN